jgi:hypothetical protein
LKFKSEGNTQQKILPEHIKYMNVPVAARIKKYHDQHGTLPMDFE